MEKTCMFLCFHVKFYMKVQEHACFYVNFPFSAYFYPHYIIVVKVLLYTA